MLVDNKIGLLDINYENEDIRNWTSTARRLLGLPQHHGDYHGYVGNMICWDREIIEKMHQRIQDSLARIGNWPSPVR